MNRGYIKVWRKLEDSGIIGNAEVCQMLLYLMLKASRKARKYSAGSQIIELQPGQFVTGRKQLAAALGSTEQRVRTSLKFLEKHEIINQQTTNKFTAISLVNWSKYQDEDKDANQQPNQPATSNQPTPNQQLTTKQEVKKEQEEKKEEYTNVYSSADAEASTDMPMLDVEKPKAKSKKPGNSFPSCPHQKIIALYHEVLPELPKIRGWNDARAKTLNARWKESMQRLIAANLPCTEEAGLDWWKQFFQRIRAAPHYLHGFQRKDGSYWRPPGLVWFLTPEKFLKIIEGGHLDNRRMAA